MRNIIEKPVFPQRKKDSHKGNYGTALIIAGSYGFAGAAMLASKAALRSGLGIAKCVLCKSIYSAFTSYLPEAVCVPLAETENGTLDSEFVDITNLSQKCTAILYGCGVGVSEDTAKILNNIIENAKIPLVIDADGINLLSRNINLIGKAKVPIILTPHPVEMSRLCKMSVEDIEKDRSLIAKEFAVKNNCYLVLKGSETVVAEPDGTVSINVIGNPGMATGGSGDVLAGIIVSLIAQGYDIPFAVKSAVFLHAHAGDKAAKRRGEHAILPSDIIEEL